MRRLNPPVVIAFAAACVLVVSVILAHPHEVYRAVCIAYPDDRPECTWVHDGHAIAAETVAI